MSLSEEAITEFQEIYSKKFGKEISREEASESAHNLLNLTRVLYDCAIEELQREEKLKDFPKGFALEDNGRNCAICGNSTREDNNWFDKWGIKCLICQGAIDRKEIPRSRVLLEHIS